MLRHHPFCEGGKSMYDEIISFRTYKGSGKKDDYGDEILEVIDREVFARVLSVGMKEFYQAQSAGFKPEIVFEIEDYLDYEKEKKLVYQGMVYQILRTYRKSTNALQITCYGGVHDEFTEISN